MYLLTKFELRMSLLSGNSQTRLIRIGLIRILIYFGQFLKSRLISIQMYSKILI